MGASAHSLQRRLEPQVLSTGTPSSRAVFGKPVCNPFFLLSVVMCGLATRWCQKATKTPPRSHPRATRSLVRKPFYCLKEPWPSPLPLSCSSGYFTRPALQQIFFSPEKLCSLPCIIQVKPGSVMASPEFSCPSTRLPDSFVNVQPVLSTTPRSPSQPEEEGALLGQPHSLPRGSLA